jgi:hypothetical protein
MSRYSQRTQTGSPSLSSWGQKVVSGGITYGIATGGTSSSITDGGATYTLLSFTSDGTLTVTKEGTFEFLMVGGGGPPGTNFIGRTYADSGGSGGEVRTFNMILPVGTYAVDVGANEAATIFATGTAYAAYVNLGNAGYVTGEFTTGSNDVVPIWRQIHSRGSARTIEVPFGVSNTTTSLATNVKYHLSGRGQCNGGANALNSGPTLTFTGTSTVFGSGGSYNNGEQGTGGGARTVNPTANRGGGGGGGDSNGGHTSGATGFVAVRFQ